MKRINTTFALSTALLGLALASATPQAMAGHSNAEEAAELQEFLSANPDVAAAVDLVESRTGGTVVEAEFEDDAGAEGLVEFEVRLADGSEQEVLYTLADASMTIEADDHDDDDHDDDDHDDDDAQG